jgi:hypothetical protein
VPIEEAKLVGEELTFAARVDGMRQQFSGRIFNNALEGTMRSDRAGGVQAWTATRTEVWDPRHLALPAPTLVPPPVQ